MKKPRKPEVFTGINLEAWRSDVNNIRWAQTSPEFRVMLSVLLHEMEDVPVKAAEALCSEARAFGRVEGFQQAIETLRSMGRKEDKEIPPVHETYDQPPQRAFQVGDVRD
jgi:hypothetical protein